MERACGARGVTLRAARAGSRCLSPLPSQSSVGVSNNGVLRGGVVQHRCLRSRDRIEVHGPGRRAALLEN